jgi:hypothetical protein
VVLPSRAAVWGHGPDLGCPRGDSAHCFVTPESPRPPVYSSLSRVPPYRSRERPPTRALPLIHASCQRCAAGVVRAQCVSICTATLELCTVCLSHCHCHPTHPYTCLTLLPALANAQALDDSDDEEAAERAAAAEDAALAAEAAAAAAASASKRITLRQPSVLEQKIMAAARERQRANITQKQVGQRAGVRMGGRVVDGSR